MRLTLRKVPDDKMYPFRDTGLHNAYTLLSLKRAMNRELDILFSRMKNNEELTIVIETKEIENK